MSLRVPLAFSPPAFLPFVLRASITVLRVVPRLRGHHRGHSPSRDCCHGRWRHRANCVPLQPAPRTGQVQVESSSVSERDADTRARGMEIKLGRTRSRRPALGAYMEAGSTNSHFPPQPSSHLADRAREYLALHASCSMSAVVTCLITSRCVASRFMDSTGVGRPWPSEVALSLRRRPLLPLSYGLSVPNTISVDRFNAVFNPPLCCVLTVVSRISTTLQL